MCITETTPQSEQEREFTPVEIEAEKTFIVLKIKEFALLKVELLEHLRSPTPIDTELVETTHLLTELDNALEEGYNALLNIYGLLVEKEVKNGRS